MVSLGPTTRPCNRCGVTPREDYDGLCRSCARELGIADEMEKNKDYKKRLKEADPYLDFT